MKIECHITAVKDVGDKLLVEMQGIGIIEPEGARWAPMSVEIAATERVRRTFYVGRRLMMELKPERSA